MILINEGQTSSDDILDEIEKQFDRFLILKRERDHFDLPY